MYRTKEAGDLAEVCGNCCTANPNASENEMMAKFPFFALAVVLSYLCFCFPHVNQHLESNLWICLTRVASKITLNKLIAKYHNCGLKYVVSRNSFILTLPSIAHQIL